MENIFHVTKPETILRITLKIEHALGIFKCISYALETYAIEKWVKS